MRTEPDVPLTSGAQLAHAETLLAAAGSRAPREEAIALLSVLLNTPPALLRAQPGRRVGRQSAEVFVGWVARRAAGEALPHITGRLLFMGLELVVGQNDPLPTPGARRLLEVSLQVARCHASGDLLAADIGTGCGATALALAALEPRFTRIYAVESSVTALETAAANGARYLLNLLIDWIAGEGLDSVPEPVDVVVCGQFAPSTPSAARLLEQAPAKLRPGGALVCALDRQPVPEFSALLERALPTAQVWAEPHPGGDVLVAQLPFPVTGDTTFNNGDSRR
ncbi:MAG TPA: class I SAM-dependent methyltransferase [Ktedonobacterales bacterium]|jgi:release factor glutamine methyltransferase|nr:class I SAM-dependent methyltransferase [Ktedonobacterales bacterium]